MSTRRSPVHGAKGGENKVQGEIANTVSGSLDRVVAKLTNEALLFVIALMLVVTLMAYVAPGYARIAIPLVAFFGTLGIAAYLWTWRREHGRMDAEIAKLTQRVTDVTVGRATGGLVVGEALSSHGDASDGRTTVSVDAISGHAQVFGRKVGANNDRASVELSDDERALVQAFRKLDATAQKGARRRIEDWND